MDLSSWFRSGLVIMAGLACLAVPTSAADQLDAPASFHQTIVDTYSFSPHELTKEQIGEKSKVLDAFWETVKARKESLAPLLRAELAHADQPRFFYYDGSSLLLSLSKTKDDQQLAAHAIARCDIRDVNRNDYFYTVRSLSMAGVEATDAALNILNDARFTVFVPAHVLTLEADYALIFMLNYASPAIYIPKLIAAFETNPGEPAKVAAITALWYSLEPAALDYIAKIQIVDSSPPKLKQRLAELQKRIRDYRGNGIVGFSSEAKLREKRKDSLRRVSDEALYEYEDLTRDVLKKMK
jgi:hypothetical protein